MISICSAKHSPGVTTLGQAIALHRGALLIEADPAGGDLAARWGVSTDPGMLTLAAASRHGVSSDLVDRHSQSPACYPILVAPPSLEQSRSAVLTLGRPFAERVANRPVSPTSAQRIRAVVDCGRWDPAGPCTDLVTQSFVALLVVRPTVESVANAQTRLTSLSAIADRVVVVSIGDRPYGPDEISLALDGARTIAVADDERAAIHVRAGRALDRSLRRTPLMRTVAELVGGLQESALSPPPWSVNVG